MNLRSEFEAKDKVGKWVYGEVVTGWNRRVLKSCASIIFLKLCFLIGRSILYLVQCLGNWFSFCREMVYYIHLLFCRREETNRDWFTTRTVQYSKR